MIYSFLLGATRSVLLMHSTQNRLQIYNVFSQYANINVFFYKKGTFMDKKATLCVAVADAVRNIDTIGLSHNVHNAGCELGTRIYRGAESNDGL